MTNKKFRYTRKKKGSFDIKASNAFFLQQYLNQIRNGSSRLYKLIALLKVSDNLKIKANLCLKILLRYLDCMGISCNAKRQLCIIRER